ncbi:hypothetical protein ISN44_As13g011560 [Arabidopsis suecica]|uniref:Serine/threonine-protein phosphatase 4 regulatory subunit 3-like central domain-containing protein n=1 Tax=Arabidopsis suecica TaxID=45249 RepID=A0A8T1XXE4_ARASU|nr:hypothetical protein ISN44_As13g011560 [Arabidopsis suecica]
MAPPRNTNSMQRVKVYRLNEDGQWDDRGTGHVTMDYMERSGDFGLYVIDEDDNSTLLVHNISSENIYKQQEDSIISWSEPKHSAQLALSFQETAGCTFVWNQISSMQRILHFDSLHSEAFHNVISELKEIPDVNRSNLPLLLKVVTENCITDQMRLTELILKDATFFQKLMDVFDSCDNVKDVADLHMIFKIVKGIISLNSSQILEIIVGDQLFMKIIGCLEYDPDVPQSQHHQTMLREHAVFKEAIPIKNALVLSKIHQTYRIGFLKDVLTNVVDAATTTNLDSVIDANNATIVTLLKDDIQELFARLRSPSTSDESRNNLVHFLHEFCSLCKSTKKVSVLRELISDGLFDIIAEILKSPDKKLILMGAEILSIVLAQDSLMLLCSYVVRPETPLLGLLVKRMMEDFGDKMESLFVDIIQNVLEFRGAQNVQFSDKQKKMQGMILDTFCEKHLPELVDLIMASCPERPGDTSEGAFVRVGSHRGAKPEVLLHICQLLCSCVQLDPFRTNFLHNNLTEKVLLLTRRKEKPLVAAAVRFVRTLLSVHDDNVQSYIVENNTLKPIIVVFVADGHQDNLLTSAVLELLEHIRKKNAVLVKYVVDTFWDQLAPFEHLPSLQDLKTKYEKCLERKGPKSTTDDQSEMRQDGRALDEEKSPSASCPQMEEAEPHNSDVAAASSTPSTQMEEDEPYNPDVTAASSASPSKRSGGSVDYMDDEDEQEKRKRQRLSSTSEGNKNTPEQGGEAKEPGEL